jgi:hypothetical protein
MPHGCLSVCDSRARRRRIPLPLRALGGGSNGLSLGLWRDYVDEAIAAGYG